MSASLGDTVATVADTSIPLAWVEHRLGELRRGRLGRQLPPDGAEIDRLRRWVVQELVDRLVVLHEAELVGLAASVRQPEASGKREEDSSGKGEEDGSRERREEGCPPLAPELVRSLSERVTGHVEVPVSEQRAYYERNADLYRRPESRRIRYAIAPTASLSAALVDATGSVPAQTSRSDVRAGVLPDLRPGELAGPIEDALFEADVGDVVGPFPFDGGWLSARVEAVTAASVTPFDEVRTAIEADLVEAARERAFDEWLASRRAAIALIEPAFEHPGHPVHGLPHHRH